MSSNGMNNNNMGSNNMNSNSNINPIPLQSPQPQNININTPNSPPSNPSPQSSSPTSVQNIPHPMPIIPQNPMNQMYPTEYDPTLMHYAHTMTQFSHPNPVIHHLFGGMSDKRQITFVEFKPPVYKRTKGGDGESQYCCYQCGSRSSPEWRRGPEGPKTLCNACGIRYSKKLQLERKEKNTTRKRTSFCY